MLHDPHPSKEAAGDTARLVAAAAVAAPEVFALAATTPTGLTSAEAARRLAQVGPNEVASEGQESRWRLAWRAVGNPLVLMLVVLAGVSLATGDRRAAAIVTAMVVLGAVLRYVQESRAGAAAEALRAMIRVTATAQRDGAWVEVPLAALVPGDVVRLAVGDLVPADLRVVEARGLLVNQSPLTGESLPVAKDEAPDARADAAVHERRCLCFLGTSVQGGTATGVVLATGAQTAFGRVAGSVGGPEPPTAFDRGVERFTWVMIRLILVMVPLVFVVNGLARHDWREAFFFAVAVAVGLTPELLPMIVSVCLARGAVAMSRQRVIVKHLDAIQNVGAMDVLCTDKTGTLTMDRVLLERHCDVWGRERDDVLLHAWLVSHFQTGLRNVLDEAILAHGGSAPDLVPEAWTRIDEVPFDFTRRVMSVVVAGRDGRRRLLVKGAPEAVFARCTRVQRDGTPEPVPPGFPAGIRETFDTLSAEGFRVLAVAWREVPEQPAYTPEDERDLVLQGYVAFLDPPRESARPALAALHAAGVRVKILTGDNELVARTVCREVGLDPGEVLLGATLDAMPDDALAAALERSSLCARLDPLQKARIIRVLSAHGHTVGFLGDGINDAPALRTADVGMSVDTAVDIARASADLILLEKDLQVLHAGVIEGRKVFANILKYVRMGASSNVGNMLSVVGAGAILPFLPMAPLQVLTNNLLYDVSQVTIPSDRVDADEVAMPRPWDIGEVTRFIAWLGPVSSLFDYATYALLWFVVGARTPAQAATFQTGWFVESLMSQVLIIHVIRTRRLPFLQARASWPLTGTTVAIMAVAAWLPASPLGPVLGFVPLPAVYWTWLPVVLLTYLGTAWLATAWLHRGGPGRTTPAATAS